MVMFDVLEMFVAVEMNERRRKERRLEDKKIYGGS